MNREEIEAQLATIDRQLKAIEKNPQVAVPTSVTDPASWWTPQSAMTISVAVLSFAFAVLLLVTFLLSRKSSREDGETILRTYGTIIIIFGALFLVVAGYNDQQMAPVMGLLGTVAGYLLGATGSRPKD